jgi:hypothetical protein
LEFIIGALFPALMINVLLEMGIEGEVKPASKQTEKERYCLYKPPEPVTGKK